ncbi:hypothetical protein BHM03_00017081 [Ensete ventricosum]|nr:hypothetical protein BHM03_00017081 [Ensete ventricosum]
MTPSTDKDERMSRCALAGSTNNSTPRGCIAAVVGVPSIIYFGSVILDPTARLICKIQCHSRDSAQASPDLDTLSSDSIDSSREQVRQVHQRLDEVQKEVLKSKEEFGESLKGGSPFTPEIQDKPLSANFRLPSLEL